MMNGDEDFIPGSYDGFATADEIYFRNLSTAMRRYLVNLKLPSYNETVRRTESGTIQGGMNFSHQEVFFSHFQSFPRVNKLSLGVSVAYIAGNG